MKSDFIRQTSQDYDIDYETTKRIYIKDPDKFYENLEKFIKNRLNEN